VTRKNGNGALYRRFGAIAARRWAAIACSRARFRNLSSAREAFDSDWLRGLRGVRPPTTFFEARCERLRGRLRERLRERLRGRLCGRLCASAPAFVFARAREEESPAV
jgi:hypothetical protein